MTSRNGATILRVVAKAGYSYREDGTLLPLPEPPKVAMADELWEDDPQSAQAVRTESDVSLHKPHTDLIVNGHAVAEGGRAVTHVDVVLAYQRKALKELRVFGDRAWLRGAVGWRMTNPAPFHAMPITYARAYGGGDARGAEARNLGGTGYVTSPDATFEGRRAPNVEHLAALISSLADRPPPAGLGVIARNCQPRASFAGTYDNAWLEGRYPLLPDDFDDRFNQAADPSQWVPRPRGGEEIQILGMATEGQIYLRVPPCELAVAFRHREKTEERLMDLDSIVVDTIKRTLSLTWHATADIHGDPFRLLETVVGKKPAPSTNPVVCC